jgi:hypothetical protein
MKMPATRGMKLSMRGLWFAACLLISTGAWAQTAPVAAQKTQLSGDLGVSYLLERSKLAPGNCGCFWLQGGGVDGAVNLWNGLGVAASFTGSHAGGDAPGVDVNTLTFAAGPRYTYTTWTGRADERRLQIFGQGLFGEVYGFDGVYPASKAATSSANSLSIEAGAGVNLLFSKHLGVRLIQAEYVRTALPNNASNIQDDLRLSFGVTYHLGAGAARR